MTTKSVIKQPEDQLTFWAEQARRLTWEREWDEVLDDTGYPLHRWFTGGTLNAAYNCLDVHVEEGRGDHPALIFDSPQTGVKETYSYHRLHEEVISFAGALAELGLRKGDTVLLFLPAAPQTVIAMLACARLGLIHSVVVTSVPASVLRDRIDDARPAVVLTASGGFDGPRAVSYQPVVEAALDQSLHAPSACVVLQRPGAGQWHLREGRDLDWDELVGACTRRPEALPVPSGHPLYILHTSGSTAKPKAITRDTGGYLTALRWAVENVFGVGRDDVFWTDSHPGWVMGHSFGVYGALVTGCTTVLYEGSPVDTPDSGAFSRVITEHGVNVLFTTPITVRRIRREARAGTTLPDGHHLRAVFLASERVEPDLMAWTQEYFACPVIDNWWQTETGWPIASNCLGPGLSAVKPGSVATPLPGYRVEILDEDGNALPPGTPGHLAIRLPLPPGCLTTIWGDDERFIATYLARFPGYYDTSDAGLLDEDGYLWVAGRTDDIINVGGDSLSGLDVEHTIAAHVAVERCAVVAAPDEFFTQVPVAFVIAKAGVAQDHHVLAGQLRDLVDTGIGEWSRLRRFVFVRGLPHTASKKIKRSELRAWLSHPSSVEEGLVVEADVSLPTAADWRSRA
ncbi:AMP-binding protein [Actinosynnema sp. NPDC059797]